MSLGDFPQKTFVNGSTTEPINAENLNENEAKIEELDNEAAFSYAVKFSEFKNYFYLRNQNDIESFQDYTDWTATGSTLSDNYNNVSVGYTSVKMLEPDNTASEVSMYQTFASTIDLTLFNDGSSSDTGDFIVLFFYISDYTKFTSLSIRLGDDSSNYYYYTINPSTLYSSSGFKVLFAKKSAFSTTGSPTGWNSIDYCKLYSYTASTAQNAYISFQYLALYRKDPDDTNYYNPFQVYRGSVLGWENYFEVDHTLDEFILYYDPVYYEVGIRATAEGNYTGNQSELLIASSLISFQAKLKGSIKWQGQTSSLTWSINTSNYIEVYLDSDTFYLGVTESGSTSTTSKALSNSTEYNDLFEILFIKNNTSVIAILTIGNNSTCILEADTTLTNAGGLYYGHYGTSGASFIRDIEVSNTEIKKIDTWGERDKYISNFIEYTVNNTTSVSNVAYLNAKLPPLGLFELEYNLFVYNSSSATPDVQFDYTYPSSITILSRYGQGPSITSTDTQDGNTRASIYGGGTDIAYGTDGSTNESYIQEKLIVKTDKSGGYVQIRMSQDVAHASDTILTNASHLIIRKLESIAS